MSLIVDLALKGISFLKPHKLIFPNEYRKTAEHIKLYEDLFGNDKSKKRTNNDRILNSVLVESIFGKAYKKKQIKELIKLIDDPSNDISLKIIKSSCKFIKFNNDNKPYVEFTDNDNCFYNIVFTLILIGFCLIGIFFIFSDYLSVNNLQLTVYVILFLLFLLSLIYVISDFLDAKILKKQIENAD